MKKVLIIAHSLPPRICSGARRIMGFVRHLPLYGWQPLVLAPKAYYYNDLCEDDRDEFPPGTMVIRSEVCLPRYGCHDPLSLLRNTCWRGVGRFFIPDRVLGWLPQALSCARRLLRENGYEAILTSGPRFSVHLIGLALQKKSGLPWLADFRDPWTAAPAFGRRHFLRQKVERALERAVVQRADGISVSCPAVGEDFVRRYGLPPAKVEFISNGFDRELLDKARNESEGETKGAMLLTYCGNFSGPYAKGFGRSPDTLLRALAGALQIKPELRNGLRLRFVGSFPARSKELAAGLGLGRIVRVIGRVSHGQSLRYQLESDGLLLITGGTPAAAKWVISAKLYEYLGTGRPILAVASSPSWVQSIVEETGSGMVCHNDEEALAGALIEFCGRLQRGGAGFAPQTEAVARYDYRLLTGRLGGFLERLLRSRKG